MLRDGTMVTIALVALTLLSACATRPSLREISRDAGGKLDSAPPGESPTWSMLVLGEVVDGKLIQSELNNEPNRYFYPASAIKLIAAIAAIEKLNELNRLGAEPSLTLDTPMVFEPLFDNESRDETDESNVDGGTITLRHEIRKLFLVSDNRAFNRLFEFVGHDEINRLAHEWGLSNCRVMHRLSEARTPEQNRMSPEVRFIREGGLDLVIPERTGVLVQSNDDLAGTQVGTAWVAGGTRYEEPFDFTQKNFCPLADLQLALAKVVRPDLDLPGRPLEITPEQRGMLMRAMAEYPRESTNPIYDPEKYPDDWVKFLLPGIARAMPMDHVRIFNKIGLAYGYVTENAYVVHEKTGRAFFITGVIYGNPNETLNDGIYGYDDIHFPFFADVGEVLAERFLAEPDPAGGAE